MIELASSWFKLIQIVFCSNFELSRVTMTHRLSRLDAGTGRGASCLPLGIPGGYHEAVQAATKFWFLKIQGNMTSTKRGRHRGRTTVICIKQLSFMLLVVQCLSQSPLELFQAKTPKKPWAKTEARKLHCCPQQIFAQKFPCSTCLCSRLCYNICNDCNDPCYIYIYLLVIMCVFIL